MAERGSFGGRRLILPSWIAQEARDGARLAAERDIGDDGALAESLGESFGFDHDCRLAAAGVTAPFGDRRAALMMAALTARIDRRPSHWSASPMPAPQYGFEGPTSAGMTWKNANAVISIHATTAATRAADRCLNATRPAASRTARRLVRCCGLVNVSSTPADGSIRRSSKTARLRISSAKRALVRPTSSPAGGPEGRWMWVLGGVDMRAI